MLAYYQVNAIVGDQWDDVHTVALNYGHFPDWSSLWSLHTDNRMFFPNLIVVGLAHTVSLNIEVEEYLSTLMLFGAVALFIWAAQAPLAHHAVALLLPGRLRHALLRPMAEHVVGLSDGLVHRAVLLRRERLFFRPAHARVAHLGIAVVVSVVSSYSALQGLLISPVGLVLLYHHAGLRGPLSAGSWPAS